MYTPFPQAEQLSEVPYAAQFARDGPEGWGGERRRRTYTQYIELVLHCMARS